eukprot:GFYU01021577.1.p1 GENE.GFYU01021577.1~~GFYU01021577.1.p1  ORF type:complete len:177 (+),score=51.73 GFYU01021577.1:116-646(+)
MDAVTFLRSLRWGVPALTASAMAWVGVATKAKSNATLQWKDTHKHIWKVPDTRGQEVAAAAVGAAAAVFVFRGGDMVLQMMRSKPPQVLQNTTKAVDLKTTVTALATEAKTQKEVGEYLVAVPKAALGRFAALFVASALTAGSVSSCVMFFQKQQVYEEKARLERESGGGGDANSA